MSDPDSGRSSGSGVQTETGLLTAGAIEAGNTAEGLDTMLRNLMGRLEPLMEQWLGSGGTAFQNVRLEFENEMGKLHRALTSIGEDMGLSSTDYVNADEEMAADLVQAGATSEQVTTLLAGLES